jgi:SulP family sulfate permease
MKPLAALLSKLPAMNWLRAYNLQVLGSDVLAACIVTLMLIPQSLAYALLAGLPAETGLYASMLPLCAYAVFGSSRTLSVGPVAVISLMTAVAIGRLDPAVTGLSHLQAAGVLALESGLMLLVLGVLRFGFVANFLSHPVVAGFISSSGVIIVLSQLKHLLGIAASGDTLPALLQSLYAGITHTNPGTLLLGLLTLSYLLWARTFLPGLLKRLHASAFLGNLCVKAAAIVALLLGTVLAWLLRFDQYGIALVGSIPATLPTLQLPPLQAATLYALAPSALLISLIGYVESISVGKTLGGRRQQKIIPDQELVGLGVANIAAAVSGGFPVTGGFSRSIVNFDAGAETPAAGFFTAFGILLAVLLLTPLLAWLPNATLAAIIIVAVMNLIDFTILRLTWNYSKTDFIAVLATITATLWWGVETGVSCGIVASLLLHLYKSSRPHIAEVGEIAGTGHFRNIKRHKVETHPSILSLRVDESLYFANASWIEDEIFRTLQSRPGIRNVILLCAAVNEIDLSALDVLFTVNRRLQAMQTGFHLSEVKGPVMDALQKTEFLQQLHGEVFLSHEEAVHTLLERELQSHRVHPEFQDYQI